MSPALGGRTDCSYFNYDFTIDGSGNDGRLTFVATPSDYANDVYTPGIYTVTIRGCARKQAGRCVDRTFNIELRDPCNPPTGIDVPGYTDVLQVIEAPATVKPTRFTDFVAYRGEGTSRVTCPTRVTSVTYTPMDNGSTGVSRGQSEITQWSI